MPTAFVYSETAKETVQRLNKSGIFLRIHKAVKLRCMVELKPLSLDSIPHALEKAKQYRLLNEPWQAESICRDILMVEPKNQSAILNLILAITDQFGHNQKSSEQEARKLAKELTDEYQQVYYRGLISERMGKAALKRRTPRASYIAFEYYQQALDFYEEAEKLQPGDNEESVLRWNACIRTIQLFKLSAAPVENDRQPFLDV